MKKTILMVLVAIISVSAAYAKEIKELTVTTIPPMSCQNCEKKIKDNLRFEKGVKKIETNIPDQRVVVTYDADKTNPQQIEQGFSKIGYKVEVIDPSNTQAGKACAAPAGHNCAKGAGHNCAKGAGHNCSKEANKACETPASGCSGSCGGSKK